MYHAANRNGGQYCINGNNGISVAMAVWLSAWPSMAAYRVISESSSVKESVSISILCVAAVSRNGGGSSGNNGSWRDSNRNDNIWRKIIKRKCGTKIINIGQLSMCNGWPSLAERHQKQSASVSRWISGHYSLSDVCACGLSAVWPNKKWQ